MEYNGKEIITVTIHADKGMCGFFLAFENFTIHNEILVTVFVSENFDLTARCKRK